MRTKEAGTGLGLVALLDFTRRGCPAVRAGPGVPEGSPAARDPISSAGNPIQEQQDAAGPEQAVQTAAGDGADSAGPEDAAARRRGIND